MADRIQEEPTSIQVLADQVVLAQAADLARAGHYAEAEAPLTETLRHQKATPAILDLLARIHAQQGHWEAAETAWTQALQLDPAGEAYPAGLKRISQMKGRRRLPRLLFPTIAALLILSSCLAGARFIFFPPAATAAIIPSVTRSPSPTGTLLPTPTATLVPTQSVSLIPAPATCTVAVLLNVHGAPGADNPVIGWLSEGERVVVLGTRDIQGRYRWLLVFREPDFVGWIYSAYCR
jgi:hypothetical protein